VRDFLRDRRRRKVVGSGEAESGMMAIS